MNEHKQQLDRIKQKLAKAKVVDKEYKVFGASSHKYKIGKTVSLDNIQSFEEKYSVVLPASYREFLLNIGNAGHGHNKSAAGPFYGIYPLGYGVDSFTEKSEKFLSDPVSIHPNMTDESWSELTAPTEDESISDEEYENAIGKVFSGLLCIGTQGCTSYHAIVLNGVHAGRVVNINIDYGKPHFTYEKTFLDWYERWLDEIISGVLLKDGPNWFAYTMAGDDVELLEKFSNSNDLDEKVEILAGMNKLITANEKSCQTLLTICKKDDVRLKYNAVQLLTKFDYSMAVGDLIELINGSDEDCLAACRGIYWYAKSHSKEWVQQLSQRIKTVNNEEAFRFITYIFREAKYDFRKDLLPFCKHKNKSIRETTFYSLGKLKSKTNIIESFLIGLNDNEPEVVHATLQALKGVKDNRLLHAYKIITDNYPKERHYVLINLKLRLKELGFSSQEHFIREYKKDQGISVMQNNGQGFVQKLLRSVKNMLNS